MINRFAQWGGMPQQNFDFQPRQPASQGMWQAQNNAQTLPDVWNPYPGHRLQNIPQPTSPTMPMGYMQHTRGQPRQPASLAAVLGGNQPQAMPAQYDRRPHPQSLARTLGHSGGLSNNWQQSIATSLGYPGAIFSNTAPSPTSVQGGINSIPQYQPQGTPGRRGTTLQDILTSGAYNPGF